MNPIAEQDRADMTPEIDEDVRIERIALSDLIRWPRNPKEHDIPELQGSLRRFGFVEPIVEDAKTGRLVAGHGRLEALQAMRGDGEDPPRRVRVDANGEWLIPVLRGVAFDTEEEAEAYLIASNRLVEIGGWDDRGLLEMLNDQRNTAGIGWSDAEIQALDKSLADASAEVDKVAKQPPGPGPAAEAPPEDEDEAPMLPMALYVQPGDLWQLGAHRVLCGDCMDKDNRDRLFADEDVGQASMMLTDPPYAIYGSSTGISADIADDKMVRPFFEAVLRMGFERVVKFGHVYVCCDWRSWASLWESAKRAELSPKNLIVWDKGGQGLGSSYANTYELIGFFAKLPKQTAMKSTRETGQRMIHRANMLRFDRPTGQERLHNAAKPVGLMEEFITNSSDAGALVFEPFCGSGSTLIASEKLGRRCRAIEIEPKYVQVTIERWQRLTGRKAERISSAP